MNPVEIGGAKVANSENRWLANTSDLDPAVYDRFRPSYPTEVFAAIQRFRTLGPSVRCLEIGVGTGQATSAILSTGASITALEPDEKLARFVAKKFQNESNFSVRMQRFEGFHTLEHFDLIYSATAFHWVTGTNRMVQLRSMLTNDGTVALFWNHPVPREPIHHALQNVYTTFLPTEAAANTSPWTTADAEKIADELRAARFVKVETHFFQHERRLKSSDYVGLLHTYSNHINKPDSVRIPFMQAIEDVIDAHGGEIVIDDTVELHLARG